MGKTCTLHPLGKGVASCLHRMHLLWVYHDNVSQPSNNRWSAEIPSQSSQEKVFWCAQAASALAFLARPSGCHSETLRPVPCHRLPPTTLAKKDFFHSMAGSWRTYQAAHPRSLTLVVPRFAQSVVSGACGAICEILTVWCTISSIRASVLLSFTINPRALSRRF